MYCILPHPEPLFQSYIKGSSGNVLRPVHIFYKFSCGEMRWPEVFISVLKRKGRKVVIPPDWDGNDAELEVIENDGKPIPLWKYVNEIMSESKHELFKDYMFLITRHFDARVKSFVSNILMGPGKDKVPFEHYSYRVEFQARGLYRIICITISTFASVRPSAIIVVILSRLTSNFCCCT